MSRWTLSAEQFAALWFGTGLDRMPFPFRFTSRYPGLREYRDYQRDFRAELEDEEHTPLHRCLHVLAHPDWRVELLGIDHRKGGIEMRGIGCGNRAGAGVVAFQSPAPDGGKIQVRRCRVDQLATELVRLLPDPPPGTVAERGYLLDDIAGDRTADNDIRERYHRFWRQKYTTRGAATVLLGPRNATPQRTGRIRWIDTPDGRYCEVPANRSLMIRPARSTDIIRYLDESIVRTRARLDR